MMLPEGSPLKTIMTVEASFFRGARIWAVACVTGVLPLRSGASITVGTLLNEMTDSEHLTRLSEHPYRLLHASSYDRHAIQPNTPDWYANWDCNNVLRTEWVDGRTELVLLDADGPGAIVRFWVTTFGHWYTLRIYLDGASTPVIEGCLTQVVGRNALADAPFSFLAPFSGDSTYTGHNLYFPIPFGHRCKVTIATPDNANALVGGHRLYYNMDYRAYDTNTEVESFTQDALTRYHAEHVMANSALAEGHPTGIVTSLYSRLEGHLNWGGGTRSVTLRGSSAIRLLRFRLAAPDLPQALRSTHLEIDFDGEQRAVDCPIGDFFGTGCSETTGSTWFLEAAADGTLQAFWSMPFRDRATVRVVNHGQQPVEILLGEIWSGSYTWDEENSMHFHASWRDYAFEDSLALKGEDLNYVTLQGQGRLVGDTLSIFNDASPVPHEWENWWGEGDEKIYVDGEVFPSHFGTGTEDYYGYAWCLPYTFNTPFIAQPLASGNSKKGQTVNTRIRLLDDIPYRSGIRFDMEFLAWKTGRHRFAPTVFWYARPGGVCFTPDPVAKSLLPVPRSNSSGIEAASSVCPIGVRMDIESMTVSQNTGGALSCVTSNGLGLSGEKCLCWQNCRVGSRVDFVFTASFTGQCALVVHVLSGSSSGTLRVSVNGQAVTNGVDLFMPVTVPSAIHLGSHLLQGGINTLTFEVTDMPAGIQQGEFGFDYLENEGPYYVSRVLPVVRERWEGEHLSAQVSCGMLTENVEANLSSGGAYALWSGAEVGSSVGFKIVSDTQRQVPLTGVFLTMTNGALCDISVNGTPVCQGVNLYRSESAITNVFLGEHVLLAGTNVVQVHIIGGADGSDPSALTVGLDCIDIGSVYARLAEKQPNLPLAGPYEDPDGDGLVNLAEYAFGGDPAQPDGSGLWPFPEVMRENGAIYPVISYRRRKPVGVLTSVGSEGVDLQVDGVVYQVQETATLGEDVCWVTTNAMGPTVLSVGSPDDETEKTVRIHVRTMQSLSNGSSGTRFMRVGLREP